jgi:hypothetical protein
MKLKEGLILHDIGGEHVVVASGEAAKHFNGMIRNNETAHFIMQQMMEDTTEEAIVEKVLSVYEADREVVVKSVRNVVEQLRQAGLLDE